MSYPGNATLTREMQQRILSTFEQTLTAAAAGNRKEALLGCDFILRLDSLFGPARELHERLETGEGPVEVADLAAAVGKQPQAPTAEPEPDAAAAPAQPPAIDELDDLDLSTEPEAEAAAPAASSALPAVDDMSDLDLSLNAGAAEPAAAPPPAPEAAIPAPPPVEPPPVAAAPAVPEPPAAEPPAAAAEAPALGELDELDDLDLSVASTSEAPAAAPPTAAEPEAAVPEAAVPPPPEEPAAPPPPEAAPAAPAVVETAPQGEAIPLGTEPAAQLDSESQQRITDLLSEGQEAFDRGEYQGAIDAWSRIFLIDIDHAEANRRIEEARKLKAEVDRKVEEKFHEGVAHLESGDFEAAAERFRAVLETQPSHLAARDYLEKLEAGEVPVPTEVPRPAEPDKALAAEEAEEAEIDLAEEMGEEAMPAPDRGKKAVGSRMVSVKKSPFKSKAFLIPAAAGLVAVLSGGWYLLNNWSSLFPNSADEAAVADARPDPIARAKGLHEQGKAPIAIAQLRRLPPDDPQYEEAQALIAQWELEQTPADGGPQGPSPEEVARRAALVAEAAAAADGREFMLTSELLSEAAAIAPLRGAEVQLLARADEQLQELQNFIIIFREGEWEFALRDLWLLHESDPGNRDVTRLLIDSYYNLGVRALQRGDAGAAAEQLKEAVELDAEDPELRRLKSFAETYQTRQPDMLYRIFVKYITFR